MDIAFKKCVQYVAVRPPPGLPLCGLNPAAGLVPSQLCLSRGAQRRGRMLRVSTLMHIDGSAHSGASNAQWSGFAREVPIKSPHDCCEPGPFFTAIVYNNHGPYRVPDGQ